jgi:hypothetical protein
VLLDGHEPRRISSYLDKPNWVHLNASAATGSAADLLAGLDSLAAWR